MQARLEKKTPGLLKSRAGFLGTAVPKQGVGCPHFLSSLPLEAGKRTFETVGAIPPYRRQRSCRRDFLCRWCVVMRGFAAHHDTPPASLSLARAKLSPFSTR